MKNITYVESNEESLRLAMLYINDAEHIAIATVEGASVLVSWNFKHLVNFLKICQNNSINLREGYIIVLDINQHMNIKCINIVHNHPSGSLQPSEADKDLTDRLIQACKLMNTPILETVSMKKY